MILSDLLTADNYRFERKFFSSSVTASQMVSIVKRHPKMFMVEYPDRQINNIYMDTLNMDNYRDNVMGCSKRIKVRIRWYGEQFGTISNPILEFKLKNNALGSKVSFPLKSIDVSNDKLNIESIQNKFKDLNLSENIIDYLLSLKLSIMNRYYRKYFISFDKGFRITVDSSLEFIKLWAKQNNLQIKIEDKNSSVLELKYGQHNDKEASLISALFPFRMTRSSKYVLGVKHTC